uniref:Nitrogen permease regulator 2 protein n=1 Tax=Coptotermes formosanus TaxID=36987 RepID=R4UNE6_COPFO|nr:nitrogen permease regulator 2 protein [Coptotermes formosanus]
MEVEKHFLSNPQTEKAPLSAMLKQVMEDLNTYRMCTLTGGTTTIHLKVVKISKEPSTVQDHQVPIFIEDQHMFRSEQWDLTTYQVLWSCFLTSNLPVLQCLCSNPKAEDVSRKKGVATEVYKICLQVSPTASSITRYIPHVLKHDLRNHS